MQVAIYFAASKFKLFVNELLGILAEIHEDLI